MQKLHGLSFEEKLLLAEQEPEIFNSDTSNIDEQLRLAVEQDFNGSECEDDLSIDEQLRLAVEQDLMEREDSTLKNAVIINKKIRETPITSSNTKRPSLRELSTLPTISLTETQRNYVEQIVSTGYEYDEVYEIINEWKQLNNSRQITAKLKNLLYSVKVNSKNN